MRIVLAVAGILTLFYTSLILTSESLDGAQRASVDRAIGVLEAKGFEREVFLLRHVASFRASDHWLNRSVGAGASFASTNFPFEIITINSDFYNVAVDDTERAAVLLHEAQHLQGNGEAAAYLYVWQNRNRLGWTQDRYGTTPAYYTIGVETESFSYMK